MVLGRTGCTSSWDVLSCNGDIWCCAMGMWFGCDSMLQAGESLGALTQCLCWWCAVLQLVAQCFEHHWTPRTSMDEGGRDKEGEALSTCEPTLPCPKKRKAQGSPVPSLPKKVVPRVVTADPVPLSFSFSKPPK